MVQFGCDCMFGLEFLQPLEVTAVRSRIPLASSVIGPNRRADLTHGLLDQTSLSLYPLNSPQLQHGVLGPLSLANHLVVLLDMRMST